MKPGSTAFRALIFRVHVRVYVQVPVCSSNILHVHEPLNVQCHGIGISLYLAAWLHSQLFVNVEQSFDQHHS